MKNKNAQTEMEKFFEEQQRKLEKEIENLKCAMAANLVLTKDRKYLKIIPKKG